MASTNTSMAASKSRKKGVHLSGTRRTRRKVGRAKRNGKTLRSSSGIFRAETVAKKMIHDRPISAILMAAGAGLIVESLMGIKKLLAEGNQRTTQLKKRFLRKQ